MNLRSGMRTLILSLMAIVASGGSAVADTVWHPFPVDVWTKPFQMDGPRESGTYMPLERASRKWRLCVSIPHLKDAYWLAANYGLVDEARRLGVTMRIYEAGGYDNQPVQLAQIKKCIADGADGLIVSAISADAVNGIVKELSDRAIPVVDLINGMSSLDISAKSVGSYYDMGLRTGEYLRQRVGVGNETVQVAWFPGPKAASWVTDADRGFRKALENSRVQVVAVGYGDTGRATQSRLIEQALMENESVRYIAGTTVTAEAAIPIVRRRGLESKVEILSFYMSPAVFRGIRRGSIVAAPADSQAIQGRIAVDQVVRILEGEPYLKHVGPKITVFDRGTLKNFDESTSLPPLGFRATFDVN